MSERRPVPPPAVPVACDAGDAHHCATCADEGVPMRVLAIDPRGGSLARCAAADGIPLTIETALVGGLEPGAVVLVHAGVALVRIDAEWTP